MQIKLNLQIFLFIVIFILTKQIKIYELLMIFTILHELGHMIAGIFLKLKPKSLNFMPFGITVTFEDYGYKKLMEAKKIIIALSGPITNILVVFITSFLHINNSLKEMIIYSNVLIAIFNLIPIYPLDGGRILKGIIRLKNSNIKADNIVNILSNILLVILTAVSSILILYLKNISILFVVSYLWIIVIKENKRYRIKKSVHDVLQNNNKCIDI